MRVEVQIAGFGGQGIVLAGVIMSEAALRDGHHVVQTQSYGPESRGGAARSDVVISDAPVDYPKVLEPKVLVTMSQPAYDKYVGPGGVNGDTLLIIDADLVKTEAKDLVAAPFTKIADDLGKKIVANIAMLGFVAAASAVVSREAIAAAIEAKVPPKTLELNRSAFNKGWQLGEQCPLKRPSPWTKER